jgi:uncharacterized damage-inducible protein DinB
MTDAARPSHPRLVEIAAFLQASRAELLVEAGRVPEEGWTDAPLPEGWSAAQVLDHLRIVEHGIVRLVQKLAADARAAGHPAEGETTSVVDAAFVARTRDRTRRIEAPPRVVPAGAPPRAEALAAIAREREALLAAMGAADGLAFATLTWVHPAIGPLNLYEWLVFVGAHELRHAAQLREIATELAAR